MEALADFYLDVKVRSNDEVSYFNVQRALDNELK